MDLFAQERKISGIVKGENDQELIIGANVIIKGTRRGTVTNTHGKFTISVGQSDKELEIRSEELCRNAKENNQTGSQQIQLRD